MNFLRAGAISRVFIAGKGSRPHLVGMITERIGASESAFSHLAVAIDADVIRETLALLAADEKRIAFVADPGVSAAGNAER